MNQPNRQPRAVYPPRPIVHHHHHHQAPRSKTEGFGVALLLSLLFWPLGIIATLVYLFAGRLAHALLIGGVTAAAALFSYALWRNWSGA